LRDDQAKTQNFWGSLNAPKVLFLRLRMRILGIVVMSLMAAVDYGQNVDFWDMPVIERMTAEFC